MGQIKKSGPRRTSGWGREGGTNNDAQVYQQGGVIKRGKIDGGNVLGAVGDMLHSHAMRNKETGVRRGNRNVQKKTLRQNQ